MTSRLVKLTLLYVDVGETSGDVDITPMTVERERDEDEYAASLRNDLRSVDLASQKDSPHARRKSGVEPIRTRRPGEGHASTETDPAGQREH
ncbi:hypothetical protein [Halorubrum gandharaense]